jgi:hypothetical protein
MERYVGASSTKPARHRARKEAEVAFRTLPISPRKSRTNRKLKGSCLTARYAPARRALRARSSPEQRGIECTRRARSARWCLSLLKSGSGAGWALADYIKPRYRQAGSGVNDATFPAGASDNAPLCQRQSARRALPPAGRLFKLKPKRGGEGTRQRGAADGRPIHASSIGDRRRSRLPKS